MHPGQLTVSVATVRWLIREQFPQWQRLPVRPVQTPGTVNAIFRIGDELVARFPSVPEGDTESTRRQLEREAAAASELLHHAPFATPRPVAIGAPGEGYLAHWAVNTWVPGRPATADPAQDLVSAWHLLDADRRRLLRDQIDCDDAQWHRGRAWAFQQALGAVWYYVESSPTASAGCRRTLERIVDDTNA